MEFPDSISRAPEVVSTPKKKKKKKVSLVNEAPGIEIENAVGIPIMAQSGIQMV